jgi:hypothetical protein
LNKLSIVTFVHASVASVASATLIALASCAPAVAPAPSTVSLRMNGRPARASVIIDDEPVGTLDFVAARGVALPPGLHHVTVAAEGYFPWDREVDAKVGSPPIRLEVTLTPVPD